MSRVVLVVIYNHRLDANIDRVERIYADRFSDIVHLMPFYDGDRRNVVPVYGSSYHFHGFVAQGFRAYQRPHAEHYLFVADDLLLNPVVNEDNCHAHLQLGANTCFVPGFYAYHAITGGVWERVEEAFKWQPETVGLQTAGLLPSYEEALARFRAHGYDVRPLRFSQIWELPRGLAAWCRTLGRRPGLVLRAAGSALLRRRYFLAYPLIGGYSDTFAISAEAIGRFAHYCGVLAAQRLFVEHAIPTAALLAAREIRTERQLDLRGKALWSPVQLAELDPYQGSLRALLTGFPPGYLYLHPIKLSRWRMDL
jgi:hypothetical protein